MILFIIAYLLMFPLSVLNYICVIFTAEDLAKKYWRSTAVNIDKFGNREFRTLWNLILKNPDGYPFGNINETISSALGKNERDGTLAGAGKLLAWILNLIDKDHCKKSITEL